MISLAEFAAPIRWLPLRLALRELRAGVRGFYVFIACIALGVMAIAGVGAVAASLSDGLARPDGAYGAAADPALLARLDLKPGARITVGSAAIEIRAALASEPDKLAGGIGFGPRLLIGMEALRATELLQPGSLVRWHYRLRLPDNNATEQAVAAVIAEAGTRLPEAGWEIRSRTNASPALEQNVE